MYTFLLCCNASAFVICAIKNYLPTYLSMKPMAKLDKLALPLILTTQCCDKRAVSTYPEHVGVRTRLPLVEVPLGPRRNETIRLWTQSGRSRSLSLIHRHGQLNICPLLPLAVDSFGTELLNYAKLSLELSQLIRLSHRPMQ